MLTPALVPGAAMGLSLGLLGGGGSILTGTRLGKKISPGNLQRGVAVFLVLMALFILYREGLG